MARYPYIPPSRDRKPDKFNGIAAFVLILIAAAIIFGDIIFVIYGGAHV